MHQLRLLIGLNVVTMSSSGWTEVVNSLLCSSRWLKADQRVDFVRERPANHLVFL
ncbi:hypothetical protein LY78DRAFT_440433 [Colletotrichum sublineola]|nr:hypothetical protein LY78DRAFT_440433 [Colletotrichum sublineola]